MIINLNNFGNGGGGQGGGISEAPVNGKIYGRKDASWTEVISGGGSAEAPIEVVVPTFNFLVNPIAIRFDIKPEDKTANIAASTKIQEVIASGKCPNVVVRDNRKRGYFTPWKVNVYGGKTSIIAMQEMYRGRNEIVGYNIEADGSVTAFADWDGADKRNAGGGIPEAPDTSLIYGRKVTKGVGEWVEVPTSGGGSGSSNTFGVHIPDFDPNTGTPQTLNPDCVEANRLVFSSIAKELEAGKAINLVLLGNVTTQTFIQGATTSVWGVGSYITFSFIQTGAFERYCNLYKNVRLMPDGNIDTSNYTFVPLDGVSKQYVDDIVGTVNNELNLI